MPLPLPCTPAVSNTQTHRHTDTHRGNPVNTPTVQSVLLSLLTQGKGTVTTSTARPKQRERERERERERQTDRQTKEGRGGRRIKQQRVGKEQEQEKRGQANASKHKQSKGKQITSKNMDIQIITMRQPETNPPNHVVAGKQNKDKGGGCWMGWLRHDTGV